MQVRVARLARPLRLADSRPACIACCAYARPSQNQACESCASVWTAALAGVDRRVDVAGAELVADFLHRSGERRFRPRAGWAGLPSTSASQSSADCRLIGCIRSVREEERRDL